MKNWNIEAITGYQPKTTFYTDFSIADMFGESAIRDTYKRAFNEWKKNYVYLTELTMVLNWKIWEHYESQSARSKAYAKLYNELWGETDLYCANNLKGDELKYFYRTTD